MNDSEESTLRGSPNSSWPVVCHGQRPEGKGKGEWGGGRGAREKKRENTEYPKISRTDAEPERNRQNPKHRMTARKPQSLQDAIATKSQAPAFDASQRFSATSMVGSPRSSDRWQTPLLDLLPGGLELLVLYEDLLLFLFKQCNRSLLLPLPQEESYFLHCLVQRERRRRKGRCSS